MGFLGERRAWEDSLRFHEGEGLVVAAPLQVVRELRIGQGGQLCLECSDLLRSRFQAFQVRCRIAPARLTVGDDGEPFAQSDRQLPVEF